MIWCSRIAVVVAGLTAALVAVPATIDTLEVSRERGRYQLYAETYLAAPPEEIYEVLLEYDDNAFQRISSVYKESRYMEPADDGTPIIFTRMEGCMLFFCKSMSRVERLEADEPEAIRTYTLPEQSDFSYSRSEWLLEPSADGTRMTYILIMEPNFWVPPIIGPWLVRRVLSVGGLHAIERIEMLAQGVPLPRRVAARE
jgi:hypothetical protein